MIETWISDSFLVKVIRMEHSKQAHNRNHKHAFKMKQTKRYKNSCYCLSINWQAQKNKMKLNICFSYIAMRLVNMIDKWHPFLVQAIPLKNCITHYLFNSQRPYFVFKFYLFLNCENGRNTYILEKNLLTDGAQALCGNNWDFYLYSENDSFFKTTKQDILFCSQFTGSR